MDNPISIWISRAEDKWLGMLNDYAAQLFSKTCLPSHDHTHHRRVWNICRGLMTELSEVNRLMDETLVEGVMIAAWFHDLGMVRSLEPEHGRLGREICIRFFSERELEPPARFAEILDAIELHDVKDVKVYTGISRDQPPGILSILSIADDLEALGVIGIYRYAEIYLHRGISMEDLGDRVLENAGSRFRNLEESCSLCPGLLNSFRKEYEELVSFFRDYNRQLNHGGGPGTEQGMKPGTEQRMKPGTGLGIRPGMEPGTEPEYGPESAKGKEPGTEPEGIRKGCIGVVNAIRSLCVEGRKGLERFPDEQSPPGIDDQVIEFFKRLNDELEKERLQAGSHTSSDPGRDAGKRPGGAEV